MASDDPEILRLRDRVHALGNDVLALRYQVDALREWRAETRHVLDQCRHDLDGVMELNDLAEKVEAQHSRAWTRRQKMFGVAVALLAILSPHVGRWPL